jgi:hypothetical protein
MLAKEGTPKKKATNSIDKRTKPKYGSLAAFWRRLFYISTYWNSFPREFSHQPDFLTRTVCLPMSVEYELKYIIYHY